MNIMLNRYTNGFCSLIASSGQMITNTTKWKQDGITIYQEADYDETDVDFNPLDIDSDGSIYVAELIKSRVIQIKFNTTAFSVIAGGNKSGDGNGAHQLWRPTDVVVDQETDTIIICDSDNQRIVRWSRRNATKGEVMISNLSCTGLALSNHRYLYVSISGWVRHELRRWKMEVYNESTLIASESTENPFGPLKKPHFLFIDETGSLYVVDQGNHRIMKWTQNSSIGIVVAGGNDKGDGLAQLNEPTGVTVDHLGNIYIADTYNNRVVRWIKGATEGSTVVGGNGMGNETNQLWLPSDLVFDKYGSLYVFDAVNHRIQKFSIESNESEL